MIYFNPLGPKVEVEEDGKFFTVDPEEIDYTVVDDNHVVFTVGTGRAYLYSEMLFNEQEPADYSEFRQMFADLFPDTDNGNGGTGLSFERAATFADIEDDDTERLIEVAADETNNGDKSLYLHNGIEKLFLQTIA